MGAPLQWPICPAQRRAPGPLQRKGNIDSASTNLARRHDLVGTISPQSSIWWPRPRFAESWIKSTARSAPRRFRRLCGRFTTPLAASCGPVIASLSRPSVWSVATLARFSRGEASGTSDSAIDQDRAVSQSQDRRGVGGCGLITLPGKPALHGPGQSTNCSKFIQTNRSS